MATRRKISRGRKTAVDLDHYVPYYINFISNKLTSAASRHFFRKYGVGLIEWRILGTLDTDKGMSAAAICLTLPLDKGSASRALKKLEKKKMVKTVYVDGREQSISLTALGRRMQNLILPVTLERENILLAGLSKAERRTLVALLRKVKRQVAHVTYYDHTGGVVK